MTTYRVQFEVEIPGDPPVDDIEAFLRFELGEVASMSGDNALADRDLRSFAVSGVCVS